MRAKRAETLPKTGTENKDSRRVGFYIAGSLGAVLLLHILGRIGYYEGFYSFSVADTLTLFAILTLGLSATYILQQAYSVKTITRLAVCSTVLLALGQCINLVDGIPAFGGLPLPVTRSFLFLKEPISVVGVVLFIGSLYWGVYETHKAKQQVLREREELALKVEERRQALEALDQARERLEERVAERTRELTRANEQLAAEIGERRQTEAALKQSEAKYRELIESANSVILRMDVRGRITFINEYALRFFGCSESEMLGKNVVGTILPAPGSGASDDAETDAEDALAPERYMSSESMVMRKDEQTAWISWTNRPIYGPGGKVEEFLCIGNDVSELLLAQQLLVEQQAKMVNAARFSSLGIMASGIAHEINNPLAIISVAAEQLDSFVQQQEPLPEHMLKVTRTLSRHVARIQRIIQGLRNLSREGSGDPFAPEPLKAIVADTLELCSARCRDAGITLTIAPIPEDLKVECRAAQISQVLLNLLNNAYDAVKELPERWIRVDTEEVNGNVLTSVTDSGAGLRPGIRDKLFIPFFTTKESGAGAGLGLSISQQIAESHHGELWLDHACPNTRFLLRLPTHQYAPEEH